MQHMMVPPDQNQNQNQNQSSEGYYSSSSYSMTTPNG